MTLTIHIVYEFQMLKTLQDSWIKRAGKPHSLGNFLRFMFTINTAAGNTIIQCWAIVMVLGVILMRFLSTLHYTIIQQFTNTVLWLSHRHEWFAWYVYMHSLRAAEWGKQSECRKITRVHYTFNAIIITWKTITIENL